MPLSINVGLSRKASRDYQSTGASINIIAELDQSLLAKPDELQQQVDDLYQQAEDAINRNAAAPPAPPTPARGNGRYDRRSNGPGNGQSTGHGNAARNTSRNANRGSDRGTQGGGGMTDSQRRAIDAISRRLDVDPVLEARDIVGAELDTLSVRQASELIDHLKTLAPAGNGR